MGSGKCVSVEGRAVEVGRGSVGCKSGAGRERDGGNGWGEREGGGEQGGEVMAEGEERLEPGRQGWFICASSCKQT